jgi:uncharacterized protein YegL
LANPIQQVEEGLATIIQALKTDPNAIETVWVSIIVFAGQAKTLVPLQEIISFYPPKFPIGSGTSLSKGLGHLMFELRKNIVKTTAEAKRRLETNCFFIHRWRSNRRYKNCNFRMETKLAKNGQFSCYFIW